MVGSPLLPWYVFQDFRPFLIVINFVTLADCCTNYHNNYAVHNNMRKYYGGMPKYIQAGEHQFIEDRVVMWWITSMLMGW